MTVLDLCAGRRVLSGIIGFSLLAPLSPDVAAVQAMAWRYTVMLVAMLLLVYAFTCLMIGRCNIAALAVAATAFWVTLAIVNLFEGSSGPAVLQLALAALIAFLHVTHDLSGSKERVPRPEQSGRARDRASKSGQQVSPVVALDREHR